MFRVHQAAEGGVGAGHLTQRQLRRLIFGAARLAIPAVVLVKTSEAILLTMQHFGVLFVLPLIDVRRISMWLRTDSCVPRRGHNSTKY